MDIDAIKVDAKDVVDKMVEDAINDPEEIKSIYMRAMAYWTPEFQIRMTMEECAELTVSLNKLWRNKEPSNVELVIDEIADVYVMLGQMKALMEVIMLTSHVPLNLRFNVSERLNERFNFKLTRLAEMIRTSEDDLELKLHVAVNAPTENHGFCDECDKMCNTRATPHSGDEPGLSCCLCRSEPKDRTCTQCAQDLDNMASK